MLRIQLIGSAPSVSNFASYSGVLIVMDRCGAAFTFGIRSGAGAGVLEGAAGCALIIPVGEGVAAGFGVGGVVGIGNKTFHRNRIAEDSINAIKSRFWFISCQLSIHSL